MSQQRTEQLRADHLQGVCRSLGWVFLLALVLVQVWALYLFVPGGGDPLFAGEDKVAHALLFGVPFALSLLLRSRPAALLVVAHAAVSEPLQGLLTTTRSADLWDLVADLVGIGLAALVITLVRTRAGTTLPTPARTAQVSGSVRR